ncbi:hypothetical protein MSPP1_002783 [Malassezia sp. CBS 17886]|nr:hypothetical protein MSPP1_002783 [Malassezia sp. CBS 17886]
MQVCWQWMGAAAAIRDDAGLHEFDAHARGLPDPEAVVRAARTESAAPPARDALVVLFRARAGDMGALRPVHALAPPQPTDTYVLAEVWNRHDPACTLAGLPSWAPRADGILALSLVQSDDAQRSVWCRAHGLCLPHTDAVRMLLLALPALLADVPRGVPAPARGGAKRTHVYYRWPPALARTQDAVLDALRAVLHALDSAHPLELACFSWDHAHPGASFTPWPGPATEGYERLLDMRAWDAIVHTCAGRANTQAKLLTALQENFARMLGENLGDTGASVALGAESECVPAGQSRAEGARVRAGTAPSAWCDVCGKCERRTADVHPGHKFFRATVPDAFPADPQPSQWAVHGAVECNRTLLLCYRLPTECGKTVLGPRYKCTVCVDYDLCSGCECDPAWSHQDAAGSEHLLVKINRPLSRAEWGRTAWGADASAVGRAADASAACLPNAARRSRGAEATDALRAVALVRAGDDDDPPEPYLAPPPSHDRAAPGASATQVPVPGMAELVALAQALLANPLLQSGMPGRVLQHVSSFVSCVQAPKQPGGLPRVDGMRLASAIEEVVAASFPRFRGHPTQEEHEGMGSRGGPCAGAENRGGALCRVAPTLHGDGRGAGGARAGGVDTPVQSVGKGAQRVARCGKGVRRRVRVDATRTPSRGATKREARQPASPAESAPRPCAPPSASESEESGDDDWLRASTILREPDVAAAQ